MESRYIVYLTVNKISGKIYVGVHKTNTPNKFDGYLGCGVWERKNGNPLPNPITPFQKAVRKYGYGAFTRHTLAVFDIEKEAYELEKLIVNENFLRSNKTYNSVLGGIGGGTSMELRGIHIYELNGKYIKKCENFSEIFTMLNTTDSEQTIKININSCIKKFSNDCYGYRWSIKQMKFLPKSKLINTEAIMQYSLSGEYLNTWNNASEAARSLNNDSESANTIRKCANGVYSKAYGYIWSFTGDNIEGKVKNVKVQSSKVHKYSKSNEFIASFNSIKEARESLDCKSHITPISLCLRGKRKSAYGFIWKSNKDCDIV
jgi:hypothetical protein